jgi:hypothetical protein
MQDIQALQELKIAPQYRLELNNYLTPLEQINVITSILYNYYKQRGLKYPPTASRKIF